MNKTDAKVYKALAEAGFDHGHDLPQDDLDRLFDIINSPDKLMLEQAQILFEVQDDDVSKYVKSARWEHLDLSNKTARTKESVRNKNNEALAKMLDHFNIKHKREKIKDVLNDKSIPDYELGIVIDGRHVNYHNTGFTGGEHGVDSKKGMNLEDAFWFITDHKLKRKNIREEINKLLK